MTTVEVRILYRVYAPDTNQITVEDSITVTGKDAEKLLTTAFDGFKLVKQVTGLDVDEITYNSPSDSVDFMFDDNAAPWFN